MAEVESAHGKLAPVDQVWTAHRFMALLVVTLVVAIAIIFTIASIKYMDFSYYPFAHDWVKHTFESSVI